MSPKVWARARAINPPQIPPGTKLVPVDPPRPGRIAAYVGGLWRKALAAVTQQTFSTSDPNFGRMLRGNRTTYASKTVDESTAMQISAVWACVRLISQTVGYLPWCVYEKQPNGNLIEVQSHDLSRTLMDTPNPDMTDLELKEAITVNTALMGNGFSFIERRGDGSIISVVPLPTSLVQKKAQPDGTIYYLVFDRGKWVPQPAEKIWHVKGFGHDGLLGYSVIGFARESFGVALATEEFQARFFAQGASPSWLLSVPQWLTETQREEARKIINELWGGLQNAHRARLLEGGMTATPGTMPLADAQFLELRGLSVEEICRWFGVPPHMIAKMDKATNNNIEHQSLEFLMYGLQPYLARIERSARRWLMTPADRARGLCIKFDVRELLRADSAAKAELFTAYVGAGIMNRNEVRAIEGFNQRPELEPFTVGVNLIPIDRLGDYADKLTQLQVPDKTAPQNVPNAGTGGGAAGGGGAP